MDEAAKIAWGNEMRRQFSPAGVSLEDGSINQDFFKPKKIIIQLNEAKRWGEQEKAALLKVHTYTPHCCCCGSVSYSCMMYFMNVSV